MLLSPQLLKQFSDASLLMWTLMQTCLLVQWHWNMMTALFCFAAVLCSVAYTQCALHIRPSDCLGCFFFLSTTVPPFSLQKSRVSTLATLRYRACMSSWVVNAPIAETGIIRILYHYPDQINLKSTLVNSGVAVHWKPSYSIAEASLFPPAF